MSLRRTLHLLLPLLAVLVFACQEQEQEQPDAPTLEIDWDNVVETPVQTFDPEAPPPGKSADHDAFTECICDCNCHGQTTTRILERSEESCVIEVTVTRIDISVDLAITTFLPPDATEVLIAHEAGHARICREVYRLIANARARDRLASFPSSLKISGVSPCDEDEIRERADTAADALCSGFCDRISQDICGATIEVGQRYDATTANGTQDGPDDDEPTVEGQDEAAEKTIEDFTDQEEEE